MERVAIVGAGIGGLTAALTLSPLADEVVVLEKRTGFGETGAGIQLSPNASRVLIGLGLEGALRRIATEPDRIAIRDLGSGRSIGSIGLGPAVRERFGAPYLYVARADLHTALLDLVRSRPNARLRVGRSAVSVRSDDGAASLAFEAGGGATELLGADLVVGADGIWSRLRDALEPGSAPPVPSGFTAYRALIPAADLPAGFGDGDGGLWLGPARHVAHYPVSSGRFVNVVAVERVAVERRAGDVPDWSVPADPAAIRATFADASQDLRALIEAGRDWSAWSLFDSPARQLGRGRVALVGDAGHASLPFLAQGGALAIEDAAVLAAEIGRPGADVPSALRRYAKRRLPRVRRVQRGARRNASVYHASGLVAAARNFVIRRLGPAGMTERYAWLYGWTPEGS